MMKKNLLLLSDSLKSPVKVQIDLETAKEFLLLLEYFKFNIRIKNYMANLEAVRFVLFSYT